MIAAIPALIFAAATAAHEEKSGGLPQLNPADFTPQLAWLALTFVVLYLILTFVALPRIGEVIEERRDRVQRDLDAAERFKEQTDAALAAYEQALSEARQRASAMAKDMRDSLVAETEKERSRVEEAQMLFVSLTAVAAERQQRVTPVGTREKAFRRVGQVDRPIAQR